MSNPDPVTQVIQRLVRECLDAYTTMAHLATTLEYCAVLAASGQPLMPALGTLEGHLKFLETLHRHRLERIAWVLSVEAALQAPAETPAPVVPEPAPPGPADDSGAPTSAEISRAVDEIAQRETDDGDTTDRPRRVH